MTYGSSTYGGATLGGTADSTIYLRAPLTQIQLDTQDPTVELGTPLSLSSPLSELTLTTQAGRPVTTSPEHVMSTGWSVAIIHPETNRLITPSVLDDPEINPSLLGFAEIRIPVRQNPEWLTPDFDDTHPEMRVWKDGVRQPIEELRNVEPDYQNGQTVLVGKGGVELEQRIQREYRSARRPPSVESVIQTETSYIADVDDPGQDATEVQVQDPSGETDLQNLAINVDATTPLVFTAGGAKTAQTNFLQEGEDAVNTTGTFFFEGPDYSGNGPTDGNGEALEFDSSGQSGEWTFTPQYDIPGEEFELWIRIYANNAPELEATLDGQTWTIFADGGSVDPITWGNVDGDSFGSDPYPGGDLSAGTQYTLQIQSVTSGGTDPVARLDLVGPLDSLTRITGGTDAADAYTFDNTLTTGGDGGRYLDAPGLHPNAFDLAFEDYESPFSVVGARAEATLSDTGGDQRIQVSNDRGATYEPDDGTESNTASIDVDFPGVGSTLRFRVTLDRYSPNGTRDQTPREGYDSQRIDAFTLWGDIEQELLFINEKRDESIKDFLNYAAGDEQYLWSFNVDSDGNFRVSWTQPGLRTADRDPDLGDVSVQKDLQTYQSVTIKGSPQSVSGEVFTASATFEELVNEDIQTGSESVYSDDGTQFQRDTDYEIDNSAGEIRTISGSAMTNGETYRIDYEHEIEGTYELPSAPADPDELIRQVPGVTSDRQAAQIAWVLATKFSEPRYAAAIQIPRPDVTFDVLEALTLANLDLPADATPLEVRDPPALTPTGLTLQLGTRARLEEELSDIATQIRRVSERS